MSDLRRFWPALLTGSTELYDRLVAAYDEPHRAYHDLRHLREVLEHVEAILEAERGTGRPAGHGAGHGSAAQGVDRDAVVLAAWFHDAVYEAGATVGEDEERSAVLAERELATAGVPPLLVEEVARLVRLTAGHRPAPDDPAGQVLCDADLAILAADGARYREYTEGVRREYAHVPDDAFRAGRARVLRDLMAATPLFGTRYGREHWERRARSNVERELAALDDPARSP